MKSTKKPSPQSRLRSGRLLKLARHLERGKLGHKKFSFAIYNAVLSKIADGPETLDYPLPNQCGTHGCAIGECPIVFPKDWVFDEQGFPRLAVGYRHATPHAGITFFGLTYEEYMHLFVPLHQQEYIPGESLSRAATPVQVASNIRAFVRWKKEVGNNKQKSTNQNHENRDQKDLS